MIRSTRTANSAETVRRPTVWLCAAAACLLVAASLTAKTRWSALHLVPDADLLAGGEYILGFDGFLGKDTLDQLLFGQTYTGRLGIIEWVNVHAGYAGGFTMGFKARILGETHPLMPSLAVGAHNLFTHKESNYYGVTADPPINNEFYGALAKSIDPIRTRIHGGFQTIPSVEQEKFNPFFAIEKYFGMGLYASLEGWRRAERYRFAMFATWRALGDRFELSAGAIELASLLFDENNAFALSLERHAGQFVAPGIWIGVRFHGKFGLGSGKAFVSLEDRLKAQDQTILTLKQELDSLKREMSQTSSQVKEVDKSLTALVEDPEFSGDRLKAAILDKLVSLKTLYEADPFDPQKTRQTAGEIIAFRDRAIPALREFILDPSMDRYVRAYSVTMLGEIGNKAASDVLLNVLGQAGDPDLKIEILIALGKMKETRAMYVMEQLASDPNEAVALTAQEVLRTLAEETGAKISDELRRRPQKKPAAAQARPEQAGRPPRADSSGVAGDELDFGAALESSAQTSAPASSEGAPVPAEPSGATQQPSEQLPGEPAAPAQSPSARQ